MNNLKHSDNFFYYSENDVKEQSKSELLRLCLQSKRRLFFNRDEGAGISDKENYPNTLSLQIDLRFQIASSISDYNQEVSNGEGESIDRRIAVSQNSIDFRKINGDLDVNVLYFLYSDYEQQNQNIRI
jgi:hypothetical protein